MANGSWQIAIRDPAAMHIRPLRGRKKGGVMLFHGFGPGGLHRRLCILNPTGSEEATNQEIGVPGGGINFMAQKDMKPPSADAVLCWIPAFAGMTFGLMDAVFKMDSLSRLCASLRVPLSRE